MEKIKEELFYGDLYKTYKFEEKVDINKIFNELKQSDFVIDRIKIEENAEADMKNISGIYSGDDFFNGQEQILSLALLDDKCFILVDGNFNSVPAKITMSSNSDIMNLICNDDSIELGDILKKNEKTY